MGKIDVVETVKESYELIRLHYQEVIVPLFVLFLITAAFSALGSFGSSAIREKTAAQSSLFTGNYTNAMADIAPLVAGLAGAMIWVLVALLILAVVISIFCQALWYYVYEHFYAILTKKKLAQSWQGRIARQIVKTIVISIFGTLLVCVLIGIPLLLVFMGNLMSVVGVMLVVASLIVLFIISIALVPLWVYYAMDNRGLIDSVSRSISLVGGNIGTFLTMGVVFFLIGIASAVVNLALCCFSFIVAPLLQVFLTLLFGVTLMKIKLALEKNS